MSVSVEKNGVLGRRLTVTIPGESIEAEMSKRLKTFGKTAKVKGFRPGKAPAKVVRQQYGASVREEVVGELMQSHYGEAVTQQELVPVAAPRFAGVRNETDGGFTFSAELEVYPEFEPTGVDALKLRRPAVEITDGDVDGVMERLRRQRLEWIEATRAAADGDRVIMNFEGLVEGEPFEGNRGENVPVTLGAGEMIPGFEAGLAGISAGETRTLDLSFPDPYRVGELAGRQVRFEVTATRVEEAKMPALDADFAVAFGCAEGGIEKLRELVRTNMSEELAERVRGDMQRQASEQLLATNAIEVPQVLVDEEVARKQREILRRLGIEADDSRMSNLPREPYVEAAERQVRLGLILSKLIQREAFRPDPARVEKRIAEFAAGHDNPAARAREIRADNAAMRSIEAIVLEDMTYDWLFEQATIEDAPMDFFAFMEPKDTATGEEPNE
ncbi:MAG: trigger factor [Gammaproteobacteria bacterium]